MRARTAGCAGTDRELLKWVVDQVFPTADDAKEMPQCKSQCITRFAEPTELPLTALSLCCVLSNFFMLCCCRGLWCSCSRVGTGVERQDMHAFMFDHVGAMGEQMGKIPTPLSRLSLRCGGSLVDFWWRTWCWGNTIVIFSGRWIYSTRRPSTESRGCGSGLATNIQEEKLGIDVGSWWQR